MFDPCGTRHIDGDEIIRLLAERLGTEPSILLAALYKAIEKPCADEEIVAYCKESDCKGH